jgi:hypothetical protein
MVGSTAARRFIAIEPGRKSNSAGARFLEVESIVGGSLLTWSWVVFYSTQKILLAGTN